MGKTVKIDRQALVGRIAYLVFFLTILTIGLQVSNRYYLQLFTFIGINTLLTLGLNMLMGYAGQISLGHAAFFGLGAYTSAVLSAHWQCSPWLVLPLVLLMVAFVALVVGVPTLKLSGYYLGMGTLGFGMIVYVVFREWSGVTGGASGLVGIAPLTLAGMTLASGSGYFFLVWLTNLLFFGLCHRLVDSRVGRALRAIHDSERAALAVGVDTARLKLMVFVLSAVMAGLAGFLYAHLVGFVSPSTFDFIMSVRLVTMVAVGGMASIWGSLLGASVLTLLPEWLHVFADYEMVVYGLILMVIMIFLPQGLIRGLLDLYERSLRVRSSAAKGQTVP
ncbi:MAG TPA: branched-chain amino acid ABC transporter permease [Syntrophobacteraceae bacterium]|nr:branched-chain amino acid ABC transporter permease [Syntrophobacteraceae bacterium]